MLLAAIFAQNSNIDVWMGSKYACETSGIEP